MEVEARNLDKKVCVAGGRGGSLLPQELRRLEWCDGGQGGTEVWHSRRLSLNLTIGFCGIDRTSWGNQIRSWSSSARVMGNGTWHTDLRCENAGIGWGGVRESPGAYDYQGLEHREKEPTLGRERMAAPHTQSHSSLEALPFFTFRWSRTTWTPRGSASLFPFSISVGETPAHTFRWGACLLSYWMGAERPGRDLFLPGAYLLFFIYIHPPPPGAMLRLWQWWFTWSHWYLPHQLGPAASSPGECWPCSGEKRAEQLHSVLADALRVPYPNFSFLTRLSLNASTLRSSRKRKATRTLELSVSRIARWD